MILIFFKKAALLSVKLKAQSIMQCRAALKQEDGVGKSFFNYYFHTFTLPHFHTCLKHVHHTCIQGVGNELSIDGNKTQEGLNRLATKGQSIQCIGARISGRCVQVINPMV